MIYEVKSTVLKKGKRPFRYPAGTHITVTKVDIKHIDAKIDFNKVIDLAIQNFLDEHWKDSIWKTVHSREDLSIWIAFSSLQVLIEVTDSQKLD